MKNRTFNAIDLFSGCGGLTEGLKQAGFNVIAAVEIDKDAAKCYALNHSETNLITKDIRDISVLIELKNKLKGEQLHLLAGCPPCQGFSAIRRRNKKYSRHDERNKLILDFLKYVKELNPLAIMLENVPGIINYYLFKKLVKELIKLGYRIDYKVVNVKNYKVPQRRKRLVLIGSKLGNITVPIGNGEIISVRDTIGNLESINQTDDPIHKIVAHHTKRIQNIIKRIPRDGGSRKDLPKRYILECHKKKNVGFNDIYGRLRWDKESSTITGGCLNPSKGRFLHPEENRCISAREAALLQTFPKDYKFPIDISKASLALLIGNALPPKFSEIQSKKIFQNLSNYLND
ncbi:MAG: DNA cytosine methyltransferase [Candidatus Marinimicrobia bacterium]|nr:DNA cytosine methyltransferase [Candidatus Neomarinimicrobiota bacterium]